MRCAQRSARRSTRTRAVSPWASMLSILHCRSVTPPTSLLVAGGKWPMPGACEPQVDRSAGEIDNSFLHGYSASSAERALFDTCHGERTGSGKLWKRTFASGGGARQKVLYMSTKGSQISDFRPDLSSTALSSA